ncbi:MAG TPA: YceI family protein [Caulobacteraceae bacterium]|jgi:polyisoprenoid-binding protein YceI|nr:YceI family protein [Caulobacteraceae bacterium]
MTRLRSVAFAVLALAVPLIGRAEPPRASDFPGGHYVLDPRHASVVARVKHMGVSLYTLRFDTMDATFDYDPSRPEDTKLTAHVDPASLDVGADYSKEFATKFLSAGSFPTATFTATHLATPGDGTGTMTGDLTLMGVTKPVTLNVTFIGAGHEPLPIPLGRRAAGFEATTTIKRSDFGSNYLLGMVGDEVTLQIEAEFEKK